MTNINIGLLFARLGLGICMIMHGFFKIFRSIDTLNIAVIKSGFPEIISYILLSIEIIAPLMVIFGFLSRIASFIIIIFSILNIYIFYPSFWLLSNNGGFKAEIFYLYISLGICILFCGSGKYSIRQD